MTQINDMDDEDFIRHLISKVQQSFPQFDDPHGYVARLARVSAGLTATKRSGVSLTMWLDNEMILRMPVSKGTTFAGGWNGMPTRLSVGFESPIESESK